MKHYVAKFLKRLAVTLEFFISLMLALGIILLCLRMAVSMIHIPNLDVWPNYNDLLETCFNLIIGVELIRMMYYHTPNTVFEVLLFAIARQIIIDHSSGAVLSESAPLRCCLPHASICSVSSTWLTRSSSAQARG